VKAQIHSGARCACGSLQMEALDSRSERGTDRHVLRAHRSRRPHPQTGHPLHATEIDMGLRNGATVAVEPRAREQRLRNQLP
jgi:hypothetical protein